MFTKSGRIIINFFVEWGRVSELVIRVFAHILSRKSHLKRSVEQMMVLGLKSLPITVVTAAFVGMAFTIQVVREFLKFGAGNLIGGVVGMAMWRELAPMLTGVVVAGRVGAAIAAELGTMKVTEQVEALEAMSQDPVDFLVVPRVIACTLMLPLLVGIADIVSFFGGFLVCMATGRVNSESFFNSADQMLYMVDIWGGLLKAMLFGFIIAILSSYQGLKATSGAKGVGDVTTKAVVVSLIAVFIVNYLMSVVIF